MSVESIIKISAAVLRLVIRTLSKYTLKTLSEAFKAPREKNKAEVKNYRKSEQVKEGG
jgi:hypothetical protein